MGKKTDNFFSKEDIYEKEIEPLLKEAMFKCIVHHLPMFTTVAVANSEHGTQYKSNVILGSTNIKPTDNRIAKILLKINGFDMDMPPAVKNAYATLSRYLAAVAGRNFDKYSFQRTECDWDQNLIEEALRIVEAGDRVNTGHIRENEDEEIEEGIMVEGFGEEPSKDASEED